MEYDSNSINIYVDGSVAPKNPGPAGLGLIVEFPDDSKFERIERKISFKKSTNNRMELLAVIEALNFIEKNKIEWGKESGRIRIITDSLYVHDHQNKPNEWRANDWKNVHGVPIINKDLWIKFLSRQTKNHVEICWAKGKQTEILKDIDNLAKGAVLDSIKRIDSGYIDGRVAKSLSPGKSSAPFPVAGQEEIIRIYRYKLNGKFYRVDFDLFNLEENIFEAKFYAYATSEQKGDGYVSRNQLYKVIFNKDTSFPKFEKMEHWLTKKP